VTEVYLIIGFMAIVVNAIIFIVATHKTRKDKKRIRKEFERKCVAQKKRFK
jgi:uncharacterized membrane protein